MSASHPSLVMQLLGSMWESLEKIPKLYQNVVEENWSDYEWTTAAAYELKQTATLLGGLALAAEMQLQEQAKIRARASTEAGPN